MPQRSPGIQYWTSVVLSAFQFGEQIIAAPGLGDHKFGRLVIHQCRRAKPSITASINKVSSLWNLFMRARPKKRNYGDSSLLYMPVALIMRASSWMGQKYS